MTDYRDEIGNWFYVTDFDGTTNLVRFREHRLSFWFASHDGVYHVGVATISPDNVKRVPTKKGQRFLVGVRECELGEDAAVPLDRLSVISTTCGRVWAPAYFRDGTARVIEAGTGFSEFLDPGNVDCYATYARLSPKATTPRLVSMDADGLTLDTPNDPTFTPEHTVFWPSVDPASQVAPTFYLRVRDSAGTVTHLEKLTLHKEQAEAGGRVFVLDRSQVKR